MFANRTAHRLLIFTIVFVALPLIASGEEDRVDFVRDVRPILSDRCFLCHGPDTSQSSTDLRLDQAESAYEAIDPGDPDSSELIRRILTDESDEVMPPPDSNLTLTESEKAVLQQWVKQGAEYQKHWAFVAPQSEAPFTREDGEKSVIDHFVQEELQGRGLAPTAPADRETLIRRVSFDITGLPPTIQEVEAFLKDPAPDAYERLVDRLLASNRYGEHMAVDWLDVARYADTYGYQNDRYREMWPWRDWVVRAFNDNLPYDEFITWQLAGDLLPNATRDQILATAFNRNHRQTNEGGSVEEEFRSEYVADRVNTFGAAFLGLTLECCRCHNHKYDPISQQEYYQLSAFFNNIDESGLYPHFNEAVPTPTLGLISDSDQAALDNVNQKILKLEEKLANWRVDEEDFSAWKRDFGDVRQAPGVTPGSGKLIADLLETMSREGLVGHFSLDEFESKSVANAVVDGPSGKALDEPKSINGKVGRGVRLDGENNLSFKTGGDFSRNQSFTISLWLNPSTIHERAVVFHRSRAWTDSGSRGYELLIENGRLSAALIHFWPGNAIRVQTVEELPVDTWSQVAVVYDGSSRADGLKIFIDGEAAETTVVRNALTKHIKGSDGFGGGGANELTIGQRFRDVGFKNGSVDEIKAYQRSLSNLELRYLFVRDSLPLNVAEVIHNASDEELKELFASRLDGRKELIAKVKELRQQRSSIIDPVKEIMVMRELPWQRDTYVLLRGAYDSLGQKVQRGLPQSIFPAEASADASRLDLAKWLVDPGHPLTARVAVNRFWQRIFGTGLVETSEDFGTQGAPPSIPRLLDWLACEFIDSGWDVKELHKTIFLSETYRRSSNPTKQLLENDPENSKLARGPSARLSAEQIRDTVLLSSGLLVEKLGGPPVKPYQPDGLWKEKSGSVYKRDKDEGSHRRSIYTYWKRTSPPPAMMTLDASNREVCVVKRQVTTTPMQTLVLLNDPQYVEAARGIAERAMTEQDSVEKRLGFIFRSLTSRVPTEDELRVLEDLYQQQHEYFTSSPDAASELLTIGDHRASSKLDVVQLAALAITAEGLFSYDETVMKR